MTFSDKNTEGLTELFDAIRNNSFGDFPVDPDALTVIVIGTLYSFFIIIIEKSLISANFSRKT